MAIVCVNWKQTLFIDVTMDESVRNSQNLLKPGEKPYDHVNIVNRMYEIKQTTFAILFDIFYHFLSFLEF